MLPTNYKDDILNTETNEVRRYNVKKHSDDSVVESDVYLEDITDYTQEGSALGASGVNAITTEINSLNNNLTNSNNEVFRFGYDAESGKRGYIVTEEGADTFYPFNDSKFNFLFLFMGNSLVNYNTDLFTNNGNNTITALEDIECTIYVMTSGYGNTSQTSFVSCNGVSTSSNQNNGYSVNSGTVTITKDTVISIYNTPYPKGCACGIKLNE